jgi:cysteinyl-tRNA synthetase
MYSCGPTVYDYLQIGNLRAFVFADILKRVLEYNHFVVQHTMNLTDFGHLTDDGDAGEDKMMKGLKREGKPITLTAMRELSNHYIEAFMGDLTDLRVKKPTTFSRASDYIEEQITLINTLEENGYTYETKDGIYFDIQKFPQYGRLGNINLESLQSGARVETNPEKRHPADFAVWKKGGLGWESRWGKGFPGWHIECSAMATATLGKEIDIHTGGIDLINPHHNAEIAQCECANGKPFVQYWLHNEFVSIDNQKIGKSLGNAITLRDLHKQGFTGDDYRYWLMTAHYRSPVNFSFAALNSAKQALKRLQRHCYLELPEATNTADAATMTQFTAALNDDLDTPTAIALLWDTIRNDQLDAGTKRATIIAMDEVLQLGLADTTTEGQAKLGIVPLTEIPSKLRELLDTREVARSNRDWTTADTIRDQIQDQGYDIEDTSNGPLLRRP